MNQINKNPNFFDVDKIFNDYITNHNKKFDLCLINCGFKLEFDKEFNPHIKTHLNFNISPNNLKQKIPTCIEYFIVRGYKFFHINKMNNKKFLIKEI